MQTTNRQLLAMCVRTGAMTTLRRHPSADRDAGEPNPRANADDDSPRKFLRRAPIARASRSSARGRRPRRQGRVASRPSSNPRVGRRMTSFSGDVRQGHEAGTSEVANMLCATRSVCAILDPSRHRSRRRRAFTGAASAACVGSAVRDDVGVPTDPAKFRRRACPDSRATRGRYAGPDGRRRAADAAPGNACSSSPAVIARPRR